MNDVGPRGAHMPTHRTHRPHHVARVADGHRHVGHCQAGQGRRRRNGGGTRGQEGEHLDVVDQGERFHVAAHEHRPYRVLLGGEPRRRDQDAHAGNLSTGLIGPSASSVACSHPRSVRRRSGSGCSPTRSPTSGATGRGGHHHARPGSAPPTTAGCGLAAGPRCGTRRATYAATSSTSASTSPVALRLLRAAGRGCSWRSHRRPRGSSCAVSLRCNGFRTSTTRPTCGRRRGVDRGAVPSWSPVCAASSRGCCVARPWCSRCRPAWPTSCG